MKKVFVGVYEIGYEHVRLYLREGSGANTFFLPADKGITIMEIGGDHDKWRKVVASLLHEAQEHAMCRLGLAYYPAGALNSGTANCSFMLNHEQFDECCCRASDILASSLPDLSIAWKKWRANKEVSAKTTAVKKPAKYINETLICPKCRKDGKKILVKSGGGIVPSHYRCDHCGWDFKEPVKEKKGK